LEAFYSLCYEEYRLEREMSEDQAEIGLMKREIHTRKAKRRAQALAIAQLQKRKTALMREVEASMSRNKL